MDVNKFNHPFATDPYLQNVQKELKKSLQSVEEKTASDELIDFVLKCCQYNPKDRATPSELLNHPFITKHNDMDKIQPLIGITDWSGAAIPTFEKAKEFMRGLDEGLFA